MAKTKTVYVCQECGSNSHRWSGRCNDCGSWNSLQEEVLAPPSRSTGMTLNQGPGQLIALDAVEGSEGPRISSGIEELDRVLGGGVVPGVVLLLGGAPGIGKSTLLLQMAKKVSENLHPVLYISGEESAQQIRLRADRLESVSDKILLFNETRFEVVVQQIEKTKPGLVIVDSIQTLFRSDLTSAPGSVTQVRECAAGLMRIAKNTQMPTLLVGHVTKDGNIAGPRVLEHLVDTVLSFEGEQESRVRLLRSSKNRFGPSHEVGLFEMTGKGLIPVSEASAFFLQQRSDGLTGSLVYPSLEGSRPILVEVQALVTESYAAAQGVPPARRTVGMDGNRMSLLLAVLGKRLKSAGLGKHDVYAKVAGGLKLQDPALDLALALALISSRDEKPVHRHTAAFGEIGLGGEIRPVTGTEIRLKELERLGFKKCLLPAGSVNKELQAGTRLKLIGLDSVSRLRDAI
ncbi:MAG: DNA repair protein RadA [Candidatus Eremiobacteraeota bacterium]|nr:DNA repair protein RadA [Candidatus Eremiobacteraeota bacterium]